MEHTAVVIGSGMGGLAVAQVLTKHFGSVILIDKDHPEALKDSTCVEVWKEGAKVRPGVLQYNQIHALQAKGLLALDDIFDGRYSTTLKAAGGNICNMLNSTLWHHPMAGIQPWLRPTVSKGAGREPEPIHAALCTRHMFETTARKLVANSLGVQFKYGVAVTGLLFGEQGDAGVAAAADVGAEHKKVTGVRLSDGSTLSAALVVDCTGRGSNLPNWLATAGYKRPRTSRAGCDAGYTGWFDPRVEKILDDSDVQAIVCLATAPVRTMCLAFRVERGLCMMSVGGFEGMYPSANEGSVLKFAHKEVWHPCASHIVAGSTPVTPVSGAHQLGNTWRHYEDATLPDGLLVMADAVCSFNPTYGQGMTVAATEAVELGKLLSARAASAGLTPASTIGSKGQLVKQSPTSSSGSSTTGTDTLNTRDSNPSVNGGGTTGGSSTDWLAGLNADLQKAIYPIVKRAWDMAVGSDMMFASATSNEPYNPSVVERLVQAYLMQLFRLAAVDCEISYTLMRMFAMLDPPEAIMKPAVLLRFLAHKALEYTPGPFRGLVAAVRKPWGVRRGPPTAGGGGEEGVGNREAALAELTGWGCGTAGA